MKEEGKNESRRRAKNMGYGVTVPGAISGFATCCHVALARSHACFDHLHPLNAGIAPTSDHIWFSGFLRKMKMTGTFTTVNRNLGGNT